jgi:hypothetical protein
MDESDCLLMAATYLHRDDKDSSEETSLAIE